MTYEEIEGDLISLASTFEVITHGVNCHSAQASGLAPLMAKAFYTDKFPMEHDSNKGDINKLGCIDYQSFIIDDDGNASAAINFEGPLTVVNAYTQYNPGADASYEALTICLKKMNKIFRGKHIGLPRIGCGIGGLDWDKVRDIIKTELKDCKVTVVLLKE